MAVLIIYGGLAPWSGWRDQGLSAWAFLAAPVPRYLTAFDLTINVLAFVPLGALGVAALYPRVRGAAAVVISCLAAALISGGIESLQTYLPTRISSNVDLLTNAVGALVGALLVAPWTQTLIDNGRWVQWRRAWFEPDASVPLLLVALWPVAVAHPAATLLALGEIPSIASTSPVQHATSWGATQFLLAQLWIVGTGVSAAALSLLALMRTAAPRIRLVWTLLCLALTARALVTGMHLGAEHALAWLTPGAIGGLGLGAMATALVVRATPHHHHRLATAAVVALLAQVLVVNLMPANPFDVQTLEALRPLRPDHWLHVRALLEWVGMAWPYLMGLTLSVYSWRLRRQ